MRINNIEIDVKVNKSLFYILPILDKFINLEFIDLLQNTYIHNNDKDKEFSVLYKFSGTKEYLKFEEKLCQNELFLGHEDYDEYVLYKFKLPQSVLESKHRLVNRMVYHNPNSSKKSILDFAKRRGFKNTDVFDKYLFGAVQVSALDMDKENFSNWVQEEKGFLDANELYKKRKNNE